MKYRAWFQCIKQECKETYPINSIVYRCKTCGSLLEVKHDLEALARRDAKAWMKLFEDRYKSTQWPYGSGVWGKKEWILPEVHDDNVVSLYEGGTNLFWAERLGKMMGLDNLWVKLCGNSHSGSFKDLGMTVLVSNVKQMIADGAPIKAVACASTGDTSARASSKRKDISSTACSADSKRRPRALAGHGFRRLHARRPGDYRGRGNISCQLHEFNTHRGAEDSGHRDRPAVRLGDPRRDNHPGRQSG
jgi:hypothetical protein